MTNFIDLTIPISEDVVLVPSRYFTGEFPTYPTPKFTKLMTPDSDPLGIRTVSAVSMLCHTATHLDAPRHFVPDGATIDEIDLDVLIGDALVADFFGKKDGEAITADELAEQLHGQVQPGLRLIVRTGYTTKYWGTEEYYLGGPYLEQEAAEWIVDAGFVLCVFDFVPDSVKQQTLGVHRTLLPAGIPFVEYPTNVEAIKSRRVKLFVIPMKLLGSDGAPARVFVEE